MSLPKPKKYCKNCGLKIEVLLQNNPIGLNKYCSIQCFTAHKKMSKKSTENTKAATITVTKNRTKRVKAVEKITQVIKSVAKPILDRDEEYKEFIRNRKCLVCNAETPHAHHLFTGGMGTKATDYSCIPLCHEHHTDGTYAYHRIGRKTFEEHFKIDLTEELNKCLMEFIRTLKTS